MFCKKRLTVILITVASSAVISTKANTGFLKPKNKGVHNIFKPKANICKFKLCFDKGLLKALTVKWKA